MPIPYERLVQIYNRMNGPMGFLGLYGREKKDIKAAIRELIVMRAPSLEKALETRVSRSLKEAGLTKEQAKLMSDKELLRSVKGIGKKGVEWIRQT